MCVSDHKRGRSGGDGAVGSEPSVLAKESIEPSLPLTPTQNAAETLYLMSSPRVGMSLIAGTIILYSLTNACVWTAVPERSAYGELEMQAARFTFTMQLAAIVLDLFTRPRMLQQSSWAHRVVLVVKLCSAATNFALCVAPSPVIVDPITGRPNAMLRWAEWVVLSFTMTFLVEALDASQLRQPILTALSQSGSTLCGMLLPLCGQNTTWPACLVVSFLLYGYMFVRERAKQREFKRARQLLPADSYALRKAGLGAWMLSLCLGMWTLFVVIWLADVLYWSRGSARGGTDFAFIADCVIDMLTKMLYSSFIHEKADAELVLFQQERLLAEDERVRVVWASVFDVLVVTQRVGSNLVSVSSPSVRTLVGEAEAGRWEQGVQHSVPPTPEAGKESTSGFGEKGIIEVAGFEALVRLAWHRSSFQCSFDERVCEVCSSVRGSMRVVVVRDVTDRVKRNELDRELMLSEVARTKDEEVRSPCQS